MECNRVRKNLREYAKDEIKDDSLISEMEAHIKGCPVCKKELLLWQDVLQRREQIKRMGGDLSFRDRMRKRRKEADVDYRLPPVVRRLKAMDKLFSSVKGKLIIQVTFLLLAFLLFFMFINKETNIMVPILVVIGFGSIFFLVLRKKK